MAHLLHVQRKIVILVLEGSGDFSLSSADEEYSKMIGISPNILLDLQMQSINSMGLGCLAQIVKASKEFWGSEYKGVNVINVSPEGKYLFKISHIEKELNSWPSYEAYAEHLRNHK